MRMEDREWRIAVISAGTLSSIPHSLSSIHRPGLREELFADLVKLAAAYEPVGQVTLQGIDLSDILEQIRVARDNLTRRQRENECLLQHHTLQVVGDDLEDLLPECQACVAV